MISIIKKNRFQSIISISLFVLVSLVLFSRAVMARFSHDEYQFIAGGQFFREKGLVPYLDYPYMHMPYMPLINGAVLFFSKQDFLTARLFNEVGIFLSSLLLFSFTRRLFAGTNVFLKTSASILAVFLFIADRSLMSMDGQALNHSFPVLLSIAMLWVYWKPLDNQSRKSIFLIIGVLAGVATGIRLNFAVLCAPALFAILFDPIYKNRKERLLSFFVFCVGLGVGLVPAGILFLLAPRPFIYGNFHYIALNTIYRNNLGYAFSMNLSEKLSYFTEKVLSDPAGLMLYLLFIVLAIVACVLWKKNRKREAFLILFIYSFAAVLIPSGFAPTPLWPQYFFAPVPFLIAGLFGGLAVLFQNKHKWMGVCLMMVFAVLLLSPSFLSAAANLPDLANPKAWTTTNIHALSEDIRAKSGCKEKCKILTLAPILPIESGLDSYEMFAVGPFSWRTAPLLSKERRNEYHIISYEDLPEFLQRDPPAAILTGTEAYFDGFSKDIPGAIDQPFIDYAVQHQYQPVKITGKVKDLPADLVLWVKSPANLER